MSLVWNYRKQFETIHKMCGYNLRKCNSASTLSSSIEREMPKVILALSTNHKVEEVFERTLPDGFSCVNTRLAFDTEILINFSRGEFNNMAIDESYQAFKRLDLKVGTS